LQTQLKILNAKDAKIEGIFLLPRLKNSLISEKLEETKSNINILDSNNSYNKLDTIYNNIKQNKSIGDINKNNLPELIKKFDEEINENNLKIKIKINMHWTDALMIQRT